jgi:hypothetical protein
MKKLESLRGSKFELSRNELNIHGGLVAGPKKSYRYEDTSPDEGGGCDQVVVDYCWVY